MIFVLLAVGLHSWVNNYSNTIVTHTTALAAQAMGSKQEQAPLVAKDHESGC